MNKIILTIFISALTTVCFGQTTQTKYFNNRSLSKEVSQKKAKFSQTITQKADSTVTLEIKDLKKEEIVYSRTLKGNEPFGIWKFRSGSGYITIDYNFSLVYSKTKCNDSFPIKTLDFFVDNDSLGYKAPKLSTGETSIYEFISKNLIYPSLAIEEGIQGTVYLQFTLTKEGTLENLIIIQGRNRLLDKEAARVVRLLKFSSAPTIKGQAVTFNCVALPLKFALIE